ncbi:AMP-binding protein [Acidiplasma aeolicum]|jgi:acyl-CoA synthetase (AMP-forming)/AMP-acid ligase II|uniref:AMP-binding protein n=1 Tax=Acidiplasma aeolicum TaxID=507754 RepID=UPI00371C3EEF
MAYGYNVINILKRAYSLFPEHKVIGEKTVTYRELYSNVLKISTSMNEMGISKGTVFAVADYNSLEFLELLYAAAMTGSIIYPVNIKLPWNMVMETIRESGARYIFASEDFINAGIGREMPKDHIISIGPDQNYKNFDDLLITDTSYEREISGNEDYSILFTSGTTGKPKEVLYTSEKAVNGAMSILYQLGMFPSPASLNHNDTILSLIPFYHIWSWGSAFHAAYLGSSYVLTGKYSPDNVISMIKRNKVTWINAVPTMVYDLISHDVNDDLNGIKMLIGGSPVSNGIASRLRAKNIKFSTIYGGTDMLAASISLGNDGDLESLRSITHPVPMVEASVRDSSGKILENNTMGELWISSPWLPGKYLNIKEQNPYNGGWFKTGDVAMITNSGGIKILDRLKDVIKSGGEWIPTSILESIISEFPGIDICAVTSINDEKWGERPVAWIKASGEIDLDKLREFMDLRAESGDIKKWWIPVSFRIIKEMPMTSVGKIDKAKLRTMA